MNLESYQSMDREELKKRVADVKKRLGGRLLILGHYYQQDEVIEFSDRQGDSFALAKAGAASKDAEFIVFCGVHFMAESSCILASRVGEDLSSPSGRLKSPPPRLQRVFMPDPDAGCPLADMANIEQVEDAWAALEDAGVSKDIVPITYINSSAELKAFCGKNDGLVCTSSNAGKAFDWALSKKRKIFFFPDEHLGRNTANAKGFKKSDMVVWDPLETAGGVNPKALADAKIILWKGHCHVHTFFNLEHVKHAREKYPGCKIIVHPECTEDVVKASDANGSTSFLKKYAEDAPSGSTVVIGTEINLVNRLARENPAKKIVPLARSLCPNMFRTSLADLCYTLENLPHVNEIEVPAYIIDEAKIALQRMLEL